MQTIANVIKTIGIGIKEYAKSIKPATWIKISGTIGLLGIGVAGGYLLQQPKVNKLNDKVNQLTTENERLKNLICSYHEQFLQMRAENESIKATVFGQEAKEKTSKKAYILYLYAAKEFIELNLRPRNNQGALVLQENEYEFYGIFRKIINGGQLNKQDSIILQNYVYPKHKKEIEELIEPDCNDLLKKIGPKL